MNRRRTSDWILASHSARSVQRQQQYPRKTSRSATRWAALDRLRARIDRSIDRWAERRSQRAANPGISLIGLDVATPPGRLRTSSWAPVVVAAVIGAMFLAVLRMDVIRMRFTLAGTFEEELRLKQLKRELTVDMRQLRDPAVLARRARERSFRRAERLIDLEGDGRSRAPARLEEPAGDVELASATSGHRADLRP